MAMQEAPENPATDGMEDELVLTRVFDAPRALVWKVWTDPKHVADWWGPRGFTNPVCDLDVRPGGAIRIDMRAPDGNVHPMTGVYREVAEPERLAFVSGALDGEGRPLFEVLTTVTFAESDGRTTVTVRVRVLRSTPEAAPHLAGAEAGWTQQMARLAEHLAAASSGDGGRADREIVARRLYDAPRETVFRMWTDPAHVARWWGPRGFTTTIREMDVRPGGFWRFVMHGPDGVDHENEIAYLEVVEPRRLRYAHVVEPRFEHEVTFTALPGGTEVTVRMRFASAEMRDRAVREYGAEAGLNQTLDRLTEWLPEGRG